MKQYEIAKARGDKGWELVLISSTEADIKIASMNSVIANEDYVTTKNRMDKLIAHCIDTLETPVLKEMCRKELPMFASRIYLQWVELYGSRNLGWLLLALLKGQGKKIPQKTEERLGNLPDNYIMAQAERVPIDVSKGSEGKAVVRIPLSSDEDIEIPAQLFNHATSNETFPKEVEKEIRRRTDEILGQEAKEEYEAGYPSLRASAERALRWEWQQDNMEKMKASGVKLVWISTHANCSKRCQPYQGKLYSLDNTEGKTKEGYEFKPIEVATDIFQTTKTGRVWKNGCLSGFNCRHKMIKYTGTNKPETIPDEVIKKERELEKQQRWYERTIRKMKLTLRALVDKNQKRELKIKIKALEKEYEEFCHKNKLPYNPWRCEV